MLNEALLDDMGFLPLQLREKDKVMHLYFIWKKLLIH
jgi:hypothetical protein